MDSCYTPPLTTPQQARFYPENLVIEATVVENFKIWELNAKLMWNQRPQKKVDVNSGIRTHALRRGLESSPGTSPRR